jgi:antitoxin FitA
MRRVFSPVSALDEINLMEQSYADGSVVLTVRDVPDDTRNLLAQDARERGRSLQAFLLSILSRQAAFSRNRQLLAEIESDVGLEGGAAEDAPDVAELLAQERAGTEDLQDNEDPGGRVPL